ncbi:MAG: peptidoglycan-binding protein [Caldilinea sp. CFX5]|nr:peptidoglycan-binding protein [Caldilinea sp. CFX5]
MRKKRLLSLFSVLALVILVSAGSWIAGSQIQSPAEIAARTAPPTPSPILFPIEERTLSTVIITRGTARFGASQAISLVPSTIKGEVGVVTTLPARGDQLTEGASILTVSGRPLFILQGDVPTFRDLGPGVVGEDVQQLEAALQRLGFDPGPADSRYDEQTEAAVTAWYQAAGWEPFGPTEEQLAHLQTLEQEFAVAQNELDAADDAVTAARLTIDAAAANTDSAIQTAKREVAVKTALRDQITANARSTKEERANADADLEVAHLALTAVELAGNTAIQEATNALRIAERAARVAQNQLMHLTSSLERLRSKTGIQVPADEVVFVPSVPVRVEQLDVAIGAAASGPVLTVTNNQLAIDSSLPLDEAALVQPGMPVTIDEPEKGITAAGVVARIAEAPGTDGVDGFHIYFETEVVSTTTTLEGFSLRLTIPVQSTGGAVMVVPISALSLAADGSQHIQIYENGAIRFVQIEAGLAAEGYVQVTPVNGALAPGQPVLIGYDNHS